MPDGLRIEQPLSNRFSFSKAYTIWPARFPNLPRDYLIMLSGRSAVHAETRRFKVSLQEKEKPLHVINGPVFRESCKAHTWSNAHLHNRMIKG